jgi:hypothetical protein
MGFSQFPRPGNGFMVELVALQGVEFVALRGVGLVALRRVVRRSGARRATPPAERGRNCRSATTSTNLMKPPRSSPLPSGFSLSIQRTPHPDPRPHHHMGVYLGGRHILMSEELLHRADVISILQ